MIEERLKTARKNAKYSQRDLAKVLGIAYRTLQRYETEADTLSIKMAVQIASICGVDPNWLLTGVGDMVNGIKGIATDEKIQAIGHNIIPIDPATGLVLEVEAELGVKLNDKQRKAVVEIMRKELNHKLKEQRPDITNLIQSFIGGGGK